MAKSFNATMADRFTKIRTDAATINQYIHDTAVLIADHAANHGDCSTAQGLVMAMPASFRREMLILWFRTFTPIVVKNDDKWTAKMLPKDHKLYVPFDLDAGKAKTFMDLAKKNKEPEPLDFTALFLYGERQAKRLEKKIEDGLVAPDQLEAAKSLIAQLRAIKVEKIAAPAPAPEEAPAPEGDAAAAMAAAAA